MKRMRLAAAGKLMLAVVTVVLVGCAAQRLHGDAMRFIDQGEHDKALATLREALRYLR